ncbi:gluzincin family metallopeptidase [Arachidicoccus ginsenosidimutans]|uniref:hypothetical protein n=1 Tax=Arachidicoccus sp. BS20 TaxID=1850526 RepID=UPI0012E7A3F4|nr:hypothetical protein [Arachidicoccus sp. BS20]
MKKNFLLTLLFPCFCFSQSKQTPALHYYIYATLNDTAKTITAFEKVVYKNNTSQPQNFVWFRLYPNAYANDKTAYSEYLLKQNDMRFYFAKNEQRGYINQLDFKENDVELKTEFDSSKNDVMKVFLSNPLQPGDSAEITTPFFVKLPYDFSGFGYNDGDSIYLSHWYPEVAYHDNNDWSLKSYINYYSVKSNNASYNVRITTSVKDYIAFATKNEEGTIYYTAPLNIISTDKGDNKTTINYYSSNAQDFEFLTPENAGEVVQLDYFPPTNFDKLIPRFFKNKKPNGVGTTQHLINQKINGIDTPLHKSLKPAFLFNLKETDKYHYLSFLPSVGYNNYDKAMLGIMVHNYQLPLNKFNFLLAPMYATNSKTLAGVGRLEYNIWKPNAWWRFSVSGERFSMNDLSLNTVEPVFLQVNKFVPSIGYTKYYRENAPYKKWNFLLRAFVLKQDYFTYPQINDSTYTVSKSAETKTIVEFQTTLKDDRALYPYSMNFKIDGDKDFLRLGFTGNYFLNYDASGKGLNVRLFAGKFIYLNSNSQYGLDNYNLSPYFLTLSGRNGSQDFSYSNYFIGRNEQTGWMSQQIMQGDGFFKVASPLVEPSIGVSDNWIGALNFTADVPDKINPFSVLPFKVPLRVFFDAGTYSEAWNDNPQSGKYLYDAGLQVSVLHDAVTVYFPLLYSKVYRDNYKSAFPTKRFVHTISFSIDLEKLKPKVLNKILPL